MKHYDFDIVLFSLVVLQITISKHSFTQLTIILLQKAQLSL